MGKLNVVVALTTRENDYQAEQAVCAAEIATRLGVLDDAETLFARCLTLAPTFLLARAGYAHVLMKQGKFDRSLVHIDHLLAADPDNSAYRILLASVLIRVGRHEEAIENYRRVF